MSIADRSRAADPAQAGGWPGADACIKCNLCTAACPVMRADADFPGPKRLGPDWYRALQAGQGEPLAHVDDCTFCQLCEAACPVAIPVAHLIAWHKHRRAKPLRYRGRDFVLTHPHWVARLPRLTQAPAPLARVLGLSRHAHRPRPQPLRVARTAAEATDRPAVALFVDCFAFGFDRGVVEAARDLLQAWGYAVQLVPATPQCCGAAAYASGYPERAHAIAGRCHRAVQAAWGEGVLAVITLNATCDQTLDREWPDYFGLRLPVPVVPFTEFALEVAPAAFWQRVGSHPVTGYVHTTCRAKVGRGEGALLELARRSGLQATPLDLACCGAAGSYAFKEEHEAVALRMGEAARNQLPPAAGEQVLLVDSGTCGLHLAQTTRLIAWHPAYWLVQREQAAARRSSMP